MNIKSINIVLGGLVLLIQVLCILPITVLIFKMNGGLFGLNWVVMPILIPLCICTGYGILGVINTHLNFAELKTDVRMVHLLLAFAILISVAFIPIFPYLILLLPALIWAAIQMKKQNVSVHLLVMLCLALAASLLLMIHDWDRTHFLPIIRLFS